MADSFKHANKEPLNYLLILNGPPYGAEHRFNGLRLATSLAKDEKTTVAVFLMGAAVSCGVNPDSLVEGAHRSSMDELTCCGIHKVQAERGARAGITSV